VTYYQVEFLPAQPVLRPAKRFRTEEKAKKHARRVLGVADDGDLGTRVAMASSSEQALAAKLANSPPIIEQFSRPVPWKRRVTV
jgi:hypothetical protein